MTVAEEVREPGAALSRGPSPGGFAEASRRLAARGDRSRWCYVSGLVSARLSRLLDRGALGELLQVEDRDDLLARLRQTALGAELEPQRGWLRMGAQLDRLFRERVAVLGHDCPDGTVADFFGLQEECRLLKRHLKGRLRGRGQGEHAPPPAEEPTVAEAGRGLWAGALSRAERVLQEAGPEAGAPTTWLVDLILDGALLSAELALAGEVVSRWAAPAVAEVIRGWVELQCLLVAARAQRWPPRLAPLRRYFGMPAGGAEWLEPLLEPGEVEPMVARGRWRAALGQVLDGALLSEEGEPRAPAEEGGAEEVERVAALGDEVLMLQVRRFRWVPFGPEPVFGHLWALRSEADNLKMVLGALEAGVSPRLIRERLRPTYV